jgi:epoxyqueuosine reductase
VNSKLKTSQILKIAKSSGASLAGITTIASLRNAPSYQIYNQIKFPPGAKSVLVLALAHYMDELDWWGVTGGTPGNQRLQEISYNLKQWLKTEYNISAKLIPYAIEEGGIFLKDAAVLAGLGIIGVNNLLITPEYGPRIRLRALFLDAKLTPVESKPFSPCKACDMICKLSCPQNAFSPGSYTRDLCWKQMHEDEANRIIVIKTAQNDTPEVRIKYCRACELSCPVGRKGNDDYPDT